MGRFYSMAITNPRASVFESLGVLLFGTFVINLVQSFCKIFFVPSIFSSKLKSSYRFVKRKGNDFFTEFIKNFCFGRRTRHFPFLHTQVGNFDLNNFFCEKIHFHNQGIQTIARVFINFVVHDSNQICSKIFIETAL